MLTPILFASLFAATNAYNLTVRAPDVSYCQDGSEDWITNIVYNINPWPMHIASNEVISVEGSVDLLQTIEEGTKYKVEATFETPFGDYPIPCVPVSSINLNDVFFLIVFIFLIDSLEIF